MVKKLKPSTLTEALNMKKKLPNAVIYAGGSDLMVVKKPIDEMLFINQLSELKEVVQEDDGITIGAASVYYDLIQNPIVPELLKMVMKEIASPAIRNMATIGGNICNASPAGDTLPVLYLFDAKIVVASINDNNQLSERIIPIENFILGIRKIDLNPNEIVTKIVLYNDKIAQVTKVGYKKVGARKSQAISKLLFAAVMNIENEVVTDLRVAYGSVGITVLRKKEIELRYVGIKYADLLSKIPEIIQAYSECLHPIDDQRSTAVYRKKVCLNLLEDFLQN
ncbi:MAG: xanthine dehydrogenase family protein subunit M [Lachnotalea sp.]